MSSAFSRCNWQMQQWSTSLQPQSGSLAAAAGNRSVCRLGPNQIGRQMRDMPGEDRLQCNSLA
eukprot:4407579-Alexandrium_andersonii.AAC.1